MSYAVPTVYATVDQIVAEADRFRAEVGPGFSVTPNGYGVRIECKFCREASTGDRAYRFPHDHQH